ncbi:ABC transporter ATP-binding protein [Streptomyces phaeochromogenes]|uniref:ABC transporter ATP-binding protein n=1 Tax=Streptomyces phaeochromogenes TaxID=1923 RepID=UPI002DD7D2CA|nr:ABC transporter ATP-binding protein [Streptomyces phaeochromogenes]WRZ27722.1 ABC transporter ATP-binding protein/permease [Streptomyces phaeochromogenes]WSJ09771.1 ABC transporter ATP-binding protein/permease [Streptomyces phaeochromogenes]
MSDSPDTPATGPAGGAPGDGSARGFGSEPAGRELLPTATPARTRAAVRELVRPRRGLAVAGFAAMIVATGLGLLVQPLLGRIVDIVADHRPPGDITLPVVLLVLVALAQGATTALGLSLVSRLGETVLARLRERFVEKALRLPLEQVEKAGAGDLTARVTRDVSVVGEAVRNALPELARSLLAIALTLAAMAALDWRFFLAALIAVPVQASTARWYVRNAVPLYARQRIATGSQQQQLLDTIAGAGTVRAFRLEEEHTERVTRRSSAAVELALRGVRLVLDFYNRLHIAEYAGLAAVLVTGFLLVRGGSVSIGTATAAALYFHSLFTPVNAALVLLDDAQSATAALARLVGVADQPSPEPEKPEPEKRAHAPRPRTAAGAEAKAGGTVTVTGIHHAYEPGRPVLHDVDLTLRAGERVALVGPSGAGKTTLAKLIAGVHRPTAGSVRVTTNGAGESRDGVPVALVTQETHVFAGPLADDLRLARADATDAELRTALTAVSALDWVVALPEGLDTVVGEGGHRLTSAQVQQLALARLVLADPPVAVLDEATAEAGSTGARLLEQAADRAVDGRTALVVAHRLTQAATADRIVVMDGGRIVESGTHDELCAAAGVYASLWEAWSGTRATADETPTHHRPDTTTLKDH